MITRRLSLATLALLCTSVAGLSLLTAPALAVRGHVFEKSFGEAGAGDGQLKEPSGLAVDEETGQVYVLDQGNSRIERFSSAGAYEAQFDGSETPAKAFAFGGESLNDGIAVDNSCYLRKLSSSVCSATDPSNGDIYITDTGNEVVDKFSPQGVYLGQLQEASGGAAFNFDKLGGVSVDKNGAVWVYHNGAVDSFTNAEENTFTSVRELHYGGNLPGGFTSPGFAVDFEGNLYALQRFSPESGELNAVSKFAISGEVLTEPLEDEETSGVAVELTNDDVYLDNLGTVGRFSPSGSLIERLGLPGTKGSGVAVDAASGNLYAADSSVEDVGLFVPESASAPTVESEAISGVTGESATLEGEVNPRGASTQYHFEYGRCATLSTCSATPYEESLPLPDASVGADFEAHGESIHIQGLLAGTLYHFRVVAHNEFDATEPTVGTDLTFTTQAAGGFVLPDGRQWEMVSPPDKHGASFQGLGLGQFLGQGVTQAAAGGSAISYLAGSPTEAQASGNSNGVQVLSMRGAGTWQSRDISNHHDLATTVSVGLGPEYRFFSDDLSLAVLQPFGDYVPLAQDASEQTPYLRTNYLNGSVVEPCSPTSMDCYQPLVIGCPPSGEACASSIDEHANVPPGTAFGRTGGIGSQGIDPCPPALICGPQFTGASPDARHIVLASSVALTSTPITERSLYEWNGGGLTLVNILPESEGGGVSGFAALGFIGEGDAARDAVSDDGSHIFWSARVGGETHLYMRDTARGKTVRLDAGGGNGSADAEFELASTSGSRAFFLDSQQLTSDSGAAGSKNDLYECEIVEAAGVPECRLSDITPLHSGEHADVQGVVGASRDGSWVYFVANSVLAPGAVPGSCTGRSPGATCNLYVRHDGATKLVAILSGEDADDWGREPFVQDFEATLTARVSADGQWLALMSQRKLTGYDNHDAVSGKLDQEVYLYDAASGKLVCASCNPSGGLPVGEQTGGSLVAADPGTWLAAEIPGWTSFEASEARYQSRYLSDSGRLFFNGYDAVVPQAVNGTWNVYEYEPPGVGDCSVSNSSFSERSSGCVGLISSGSSGRESAFLDASETGGDVFFVTSARLASQDSDSSLDIYDAHECTGSSLCPSAGPIQPPACSTGDSCKSAPSPQPAIFGSPSSATFSGAGNARPPGSVSVVKPRSLTRAQKLAHALKQCTKKDSHRKRVACQRKARRRIAASRAPAKVNARKKGRG